MAGRGVSQPSQRRRKVFKDNINAVMTRAAIRKLARRGGVGRVSQTIYPQVRVVLREWLEDVIWDVLLITDVRRSKVVWVSDVVMALRRRGQSIYGFGDAITAHR